MKLHISRFDVATIKAHRVILVVGKRGTGKSVLLQDWMYHMREQVHLPIGMSPTEASLEMMRGFMPNALVHRGGINTGLLADLIKHQRQSLADADASTEHVLICCDDTSYDKSALRTTEVRELFMNGRHLKTCFILSSQYLMDLDPSLRTQIDYVVALRDSTKENIKKLYQMFFGAFDTLADFETTFRALTHNYGAIVLDQTVASTSLTDQIFWYKANPQMPELRTFKLGRARYHQMSNLYRPKKGESDEAAAQETGTKQAITHIEKGE